MGITLGVLLLAFLVGSIPFGYLLVRATSGKDVRSFGSHSIGAINVFRVGGRWPGILTLVLDAGKAFGMVLLAAALVRDPWVISSTAFLVMLGHAYSLWLFLKNRRFSEAKSVASAQGIMVALGVLRVLPWTAAMLPIGVWALGLVGPRLLTGRWPCISLATMTATLVIPVAVWSGDPGMSYKVLSIAMCLLILVRHKNNIRRLRAGTEPRLGERLKPSQEET